MSRLAAAVIFVALLASACITEDGVAEDGVAGSGDLISEQDALRLASAEAERRGCSISELRPEVARDGDVFQVDFFPTNGQRGGGCRVEIRAENGEVSGFFPWR